MKLKFWFLTALLLSSLCTWAAEGRGATWTLLVYMSADNDLDAASEYDLEEMMKVGSSDKINILVFHDGSERKQSSKIYYIEKNNKKIVKDYGSNIDSGDWKNLVDAFHFTLNNYPAEKFMVTVWNHGNGWEKSARLEKGIAYDDFSNNSITTKELGSAVKEMAQLRGKKIELFSTDACLMQMVEVAYEFRDAAELFAASEESEPGEGWPYTEILNSLVQKPEMTAYQLGSNIAKFYVESYRKGVQVGDMATFSLISLPELKAAVETLIPLAQNLKSLPDTREKILRVIDNSQSYDALEYVDLLDFLTNLKPNMRNQTETVQLITKTEEAFKKAIKYELHWGDRVKKSKGISIWLPAEDLDADMLLDYKKLDFDAVSGWSLFVESYL